MTIEEKLKDYILMRYKSLREFVMQTNVLPYTTVDGILKRGIANSSIGNVLKLCKALNISADELANNRIVPADQKMYDRVIIKELPEIIDYMRRNIQEFQQIKIDGQEVSTEEIEMLFDSIEVTTEIIRRKRKRAKK